MANVPSKDVAFGTVKVPTAMVKAGVVVLTPFVTVTKSRKPPKAPFESTSPVIFRSAAPLL